jgi:hypothetical protein
MNVFGYSGEHDRCTLFVLSPEHLMPACSKAPDVEAESSSNENDGKLIVVPGEKRKRQTGDVAVTRPAAAVLSLHKWRSVYSPDAASAWPLSGGLRTGTLLSFAVYGCRGRPTNGAGGGARGPESAPRCVPSVHPSFSILLLRLRPMGLVSSARQLQRKRRGGLCRFGERARGGRAATERLLRIAPER